MPEVVWVINPLEIIGTLIGLVVLIVFGAYLFISNRRG